MTIELSNGAFRPATPPLPRVSQEIALTVVGCVLTGVTYGLIRLSLGQFLPDIRADLELSERWAGILSAGMFVGNCLALLVSALLTRARGPRVTAGLAGGLATLGLAGMVMASDPSLFAIAMLVAGSSAGLTIPPLVTAIQAVIRAGRRAVAITIVNAGTSVGVVASAPIAMAVSGDWRATYTVFAVIAGLTTVATLLTTPSAQRVRSLSAVEVGASGSQMARPSPLVFWEHPNLRALLASAFLCGFVMTTYWTFGGEILSQLGGWNQNEIGLFWMVLGAAGILGAPAGVLMRRFGTGRVHCLAYMALTLSFFCLLFVSLHPALPILGAVLQSAAYMTLSGSYLVWGVDEMPDHPSMVTAAAFFMIPAGLVLGACVFGALLAPLGTVATVVLFAFLSAMGVFFAPVSADERVALPSRAQSPELA